MAEKKTESDRTQISKEHADWLREVETTAKAVDVRVSSGSVTKELGVLTESIYKINELLSVLATLGGGPPEPEFSDIIETIIQDFRLLLPWVRIVYEARKDTWFNRVNVLKHGHCHARTWHDIVLQTAEGITEGSRLISSRHACKILHGSQYESGKIQIHLELERESASKANVPCAGNIPPAETLPFNLRLCDVKQTLKRDGFTKSVTIPNEDHWRLMEALMAASPNAVPKSKLNQLGITTKGDRDNYPRALKNIIDDIGLTVEKWVLINTTVRP